MRRPIKTRLKHGWTLVEFNRQIPIGIKEWLLFFEEDKAQYKSMNTWCSENIREGSWDSTLHHGETAPSGNGPKIRFIFKNAEDAVAFKLIWST